MRLSEKHHQAIAEMESKGYVWLSNMDVNAQMRFRNRTRAGFTGYTKVLGLTFLAKEVADAIAIGTKRKTGPKYTLTQQVEYLQDRLADREAYVKQLEATINKKPHADNC